MQHIGLCAQNAPLYCIKYSPIVTAALYYNFIDKINVDKKEIQILDILGAYI